MLKKVLIVAAVGFVLVVGAGAAIYYFAPPLHRVVHDAIEERGSRLLGTPVRVGSVSIALQEGRASIHDLRVANPPGFSEGDLFSLGRITVQIDIASLTESPIVIDTVEIEAAVSRFEVLADGTSNIDVVRRNADRAVGGADEPASDGADGGDPLLLRIRHLEFVEGEVHADASKLVGRKVEAPLPPIHMKNVGGRKGNTPAEIGDKVVRAYTGVVAKTVLASGGDALIDTHLKGPQGEAAKTLLRSFLRGQQKDSRR